MHFMVRTALFGAALSLSAGAQVACSAGALPEAGKAVAATRHALHTVAVGELDPVVPAPVAAQLGRLKDELAGAAQAAMACAGSTATPEALQQTLAGALHANLSGDSETVLVTTTHKDLGAYGSDLDVQVLPLSNAPRYLEIDFRYGVECGDDNLLLVYKQAPGGWQQVLRWDAPAYRNVSDALGDFVLLTPLTGFPGQENWRAVAVHGEPSCSTDKHSRFSLDVLQPAADPAHPTVAWHLDRPYRRGDTPRLLTTEDTITFQLVPPAPEPGKGQAKGKSSDTAPFPRETYRYRMDKNNQVQPIDAAPDSVPSPGTASPNPSTSSPQ